MTLKYFSQFYKLDISNGSDWFDARMDLDTKLYIDPFLVFKSDIDLFKNAQHKFVDFFDLYLISHLIQLSLLYLSKY